MDSADRFVLARAVATQCGIHAQHIAAVASPGSVNHVFRVRTSAGQPDAVIRFAADERREDETQSEQRAVGAAARRGTASPAVIARSRCRGVPFLVEGFVDGAGGATVVGERGDEFWATLGGYARTISTIGVPRDAPAGLFSRFGTDLAAAWRAHVDYNLTALSDDDPLRTHRDPPRVNEIADRATQGRPVRPCRGISGSPTA